MKYLKNLFTHSHCLYKKNSGDHHFWALCTRLCPMHMVYINSLNPPRSRKHTCLYTNKVLIITRIFFSFSLLLYFYWLIYFYERAVKPCGNQKETLAQVVLLATLSISCLVEVRLVHLLILLSPYFHMKWFRHQSGASCCARWNGRHRCSRTMHVVLKNLIRFLNFFNLMSVSPPAKH